MQQGSLVRASLKNMAASTSHFDRSAHIPMSNIIVISIIISSRNTSRSKSSRSSSIVVVIIIGIVVNVFITRSASCGTCLTATAQELEASNQQLHTFERKHQDERKLPRNRAPACADVQRRIRDERSTRGGRGRGEMGTGHRAGKRRQPSAALEGLLEQRQFLNEVMNVDGIIA
jgi:hypothetical protein